MAKITVTGNALVITSAVKFDDMKLIKKYRPDALTLYKGEGKDKEPIFRIGVGAGGNGDLNRFGAEFCGATHDEEKLGVITLVHEFKKDGDDLKEEIADFVGTSILNLNKLEEGLPAVVEEIKTEKADILANVTLV